MISVGIDPGLTGAIAGVGQDGSAWVVDMPLLELSATGYVRRAIAPGALATALRPLRGKARVWLEMVNAFPGQGVASMFSLGASFWGAYCVAVACDLDTHLVRPQVWKAQLGLTSDKGESLEMARKLFPAIAAERLARKKDHGRAEALLLAHYGMRA